MNADTLVLLGTQFPYRAFYRPMPKLFRLISTQPASALTAGGYGTGRRYQVDSACIAAIVEEKADRKFLDKALEDYRDAAKGWTI